MMSHAKDTKVDELGDFAPTFDPKHAEAPVGNRDADGHLIQFTPVWVSDETGERMRACRIAGYVRDAVVEGGDFLVGSHGKFAQEDCIVYAVEGPNGEVFVAGGAPGFGIATDAFIVHTDGLPILIAQGLIPVDDLNSVLMERMIAELGGGDL